MDNLDSLHRKKRSANITNEQRTLLIEYMNKHPELLREKLTSSFTLKHSISLWNEITEILNSVSGAQKDWKGWRKCWHDFQSRSKKKHILIKQSLATTGGGKQTAEELTPQEEQVLDIMCSTSIHGHPDVQESSINLLEDSENDNMEVEFLQEDEDILSNITTSAHSNNALLPQKRKAVTYKNFNELSNEKENICEVRSINNEHVEQSSFKVNKIIKDIRMTLNANACERDKTSNPKKKTTMEKELRNTVEISTKLNDIYEKTYELKKNYYEARLEYLRRSTEAKEKIAKEKYKKFWRSIKGFNRKYVFV